MQSTDDFYKRLIKPIRDEFISSIIASVDSDTYSPYDKALNWDERTRPIKHLRETFLTWSQDRLENLNQFPHMYIMNGNTDSLNALFNRSTAMSGKRGDYSYYQYWHAATKKSYQDLAEPTSVTDMIVSWPGYSHGDRAELDFALACKAQRLHLDCAYLGLTKPSSIDTSVFETVSVSFSKTLAVPYNRIAVMFSKNEIPEFALLNRLGYVNLAGVKLVNKIMNEVPLTYWWDTYGNRLNELCLANNLTPTDSILFAYDSDKRIGLAPYWYL